MENVWKSKQTKMNSMKKVAKMLENELEDLTQLSIQSSEIEKSPIKETDKEVSPTTSDDFDDIETASTCSTVSVLEPSDDEHLETPMSIDELNEKRLSQRKRVLSSSSDSSSYLPEEATISVRGKRPRIMHHKKNCRLSIRTIVRKANRDQCTSSCSRSPCKKAKNDILPEQESDSD